MEFRLTYRGDLKANGGTCEKQDIRRQFHPQLKELWAKHRQLREATSYVDVNQKSSPQSILFDVGPFTFAPLVNSRLNLVAELQVILLRPEDPGSIVCQSGDMDNRIKTLLDALRIPNINQIPSGDKPLAGETPFFCLLEDDSLISSLTITTDRLLEPAAKKSNVVLLIHVITKFVPGAKSVVHSLSF